MSRQTQRAGWTPVVIGGLAGEDGMVAGGAALPLSGATARAAEGGTAGRQGVMLL